MNTKHVLDKAVLTSRRRPARLPPSCPSLAGLLTAVVLLCMASLALAANSTLSRWYGDWLKLDPAAAGYDAARLESAITNIGEMRGVQGLLIVRRGYLVAERYWRGGARDVPHNLKSASKSVISALVGIAVSQGRFGLDQPLVELLPQLRHVKDPAKRRITVRHLLEMTSGLPSGGDQAYDTWVTHSDWIRAAMKGPLQSEPGSRYDYNTANSHLLSAIITATTGQSTRAFAQKHLFGPMGVRIHDWPTDPDGVNIGGNNLWLMPRDFARFGQLFLDKGQWGHRQLVPQSWVAASVASQAKTSHETYGGYGYLWWTPFDDGSFAAVGYGGQYILVSPRTDTVVVVTSTLDSKGDHWEQQLFEQFKHGIEASIAVPEWPQTAITEAHINLRSAPTLNSDALHVVAKGEHVHWTERDGDWLHARVGELSGWLHSDYLRVIKPHVEPSASTTPARRPAPTLAQTVPMPIGKASDSIPVAESKLEHLRERVAALEASANEPLPLPRYRVTRGVNFRRSPNLVGELIGKLAKGTEFQALERSEAWLMAEINGQKGWLHSGFARIVEKPTYRSQRTRLASEIRELGSVVDLLDQPEDGSDPRPRTADILTAANAERDRLRDQLAHQVAQMDQLREALAQNNGELERLRAAHERERARLTEQSLSLAAAADGVKDELAELLLQQTSRQQQLDLLAAEKQRLMADLGARDSQVAEKRQELDEARTRIETLLAEAQQQRDTNHELQESVQQLTDSERQRGEQIASGRAQIAKLQETVDQAVSQQETLEKQAAALGQENVSLQTALAGVKDELAELLLQQISRQQQLDLLAAEKQRLMADLGARDSQVAEKRQELDEARTRIETLLAEAQQQRDTNHELQESVQQLTDSERQRGEQIASGRAQIAKLQETVDRAVSQQKTLEKQAAALGQENVSLQTALAASHRHSETLQQQLADASDAAQLSKAQLASVEETRLRLLTEIDDARAQQRDLQQAIDNAVVRDREQQQTLAQQQEENQQLRTELANLTELASQTRKIAEANDKARQELRERLLDGTNQIAELQKALTEAKDANADLSRRRDDDAEKLSTQANAMTALRAEFAATSTQLSGLEAEKQALEQKLASAQRTIDRQNESLQSGQQRATAQSAELSGLRARIATLENEYNDALTENREATENLAASEQQLQIIGAELASLAEKNAAGIDALAQRDEQLADLRAQLAAGQEEKQQTEARLSAVRAEARDLVLQITTLQAAAQADTASLNDALLRQQHKTATAEDAAEQQQSVIDRQASELGRLREQLATTLNKSQQQDQQLNDALAQAKDSQQALGMLWSSQAAMLAQNEKLESRVRQMQQRAEQQAQKTSIWEERSTAYEAQVERLNARLDETASSATSLQDEVKSLQKNIADAAHRLDQSNNLLQERTAELAHIQSQMIASNDHSNLLQSTLDESQARIDILSTEVEQLRNTAEGRKSLLDEARKDLASLEAAGKQTLSERNALKQALEQTEQDLRQQQESVADTENRLTDLQAALRASTARESALDTQLQRANSENTKLVKKAQQNETAMASMREDMEKTGKEKADIQAALQQTIEQHRQEQQTWSASLADLQEQNGELSTQMIALQREQDGLRQRALAETANITELDESLRTAHAEIATLQSSLDSERKQRQSVSTIASLQFEQNRQLNQMLSQLDSRVSERGAALAQTTADLQSVQEALQQKSRQLDTLGQEIATLEAQSQTEADELKTSLASTTELANARTRELRKRNGQLTQTLNALRAAREKTTTLSTRVQQLEERIGMQDVELTTYRTVKKHLDATLAQAAELQQAADERDKTNQALIANIDRLQTANESRQEELAALKAENKRQSSALARARSRIAQLERSPSGVDVPVVVAAAEIPRVPVEPVGTTRDVSRLDANPPTTTVATAAAAVQARPIARHGDESTSTPSPVSPALVTEQHRPGAAVSDGSAIAGIERLGAPSTGIVKPPIGDVEDFIRSWASAWSRQDVGAYLSHYSGQFRAESGISRSAWAAQRRVRVAKPKVVQVKVSAIDVKPVDENRVKATFKQAYRANHYRDRVTKTLELAYEGDRWKITRETSE